MRISNSKIEIREGVLRTLIFSRGWSISEDSVGTTWNAINKMVFDFVNHVENTKLKKLYKELEANQLEAKKLRSTWIKTWFNVSQQVQWTEDVTVTVSASVFFEPDGSNVFKPNLSDVYVKIKGSQKIIYVNTKNAIDNFVNRELEKTLK